MAGGSKVGYLTIQNFRYGLDARRSELTSQPGTLLRAIDCHVNQGAEIEKRKAFVKTLMPANVFLGLAGLNTQYAFGSIVAPAMPAGFTYVQLTSPLGSAMTALVDTTLFNNLPFAVATFGADGTFVFYNGILVPDFTSGFVLNGLTSDANQATALAALVNATTNYTATVVGTTVTISGTNGASYAIATVETATSGTILASQETTSAAGTTGLAAIGSFVIQAGALGTGILQGGINSVSIITPSGTLYAVITNGSILWNTNTNITAGLIATNINLNIVGNEGFSATANGNVVTIYAPINQATTFNGYAVAVATQRSTNNDGTICVSNCLFNFFIPTTGGPTLTISSIVSANLGTITSGSKALSSYVSLNALLVAVANDITNTAGGIGTGLTAVAVNNQLFVSDVTDSDPNIYSFSPNDTITVNFTGSAGVTVGGTQGLAVNTNITNVAAAASANSNITTNNVTATATGGTAPYKYKWSITNQKGQGSITIGSPTSASTNFTFINPYNSQGVNPALPVQTSTVTATAVCTITDTNGNSASANVGISISYSYNSSNTGSKP